MTDRLPASTPRATRSARPTSRVQIEPERPNSVSLAIRIASASSSNGMHRHDRTEDLLAPYGSWALRGRTTVGGYQKPGPSGAVPRKATSTASSTYDRPSPVAGTDQRTHLGVVASGSATRKPARPVRAIRGTGRTHCARPGSGCARSSPGRRCRTRRPARSPPRARGRRRRRRCSRSCRRAQGSPASPAPPPGP